MAIDRRWTKDPNALLDYTILWASEPVYVDEVEFVRNDGGILDTGWLQGDTIVASTWFSTAGVDLESSSFTTTYASVWISGGVARRKYTVTNRIETALGRIDDRSFIIHCEEK